jgi:hypothetical protein
MLTPGDGKSYALVSPGRRGYQGAQVVLWPEFDVGYNPDRLLVIVANLANLVGYAPLRSPVSRRPFGDTWTG